METPKIMGIDCPEETIDQFREGGYDITSGSFGTIYEFGDKTFSIRLNHHLYGIQERDIIIINLLGSKREVSEPIENTSKQEGRFTIRPLAGTDRFNAAIVSMDLFANDFSNIITKGTLVVCFARKIAYERWNAGHIRRQSYDYKTYAMTNFAWLGAYIPKRIESTLPGREIIPAESPELVYKDFFQEFEGKLSYAVDFSKTTGDANVLAVNRQADVIASILELGKGKVILLPYPDNFTEACYYLVNQILPQAFPEIFPEKETKTWIQRIEYQPPSVKTMVAEMDAKRKEYAEDLEARTESTEQERAKYDWLYTLLTGHSDRLKEAVRVTLEYLGCINVVDVDALAGEGSKFNEDLRFEYDNQQRLVEVTGTQKNAKEKDIQDVVKYLNRFIRENPGSKPTGLLICNNRKHLPPEEREMAFNEHQINDALDTDICLVSSADLYYAVMDVLKGEREKNEIVDALCRPGLFTLEKPPSS